MKKLLIKLAKALARAAGADLVVLPHVPENVLSSARTFVSQVSGQVTSGEHKRGQVMRALMNCYPNHKERILAAAIEIACSE